MPPTKPVDQLKLWDDIASLAWFRSRAERAPRFAIEPGNVTRDEMIAVIAKEIVDGITDGSDVTRFLERAEFFIGRGGNENVYNSIDQFCKLFNLHFENTRAWLAWKGKVRRTRKPPSKG